MRILDLLTGICKPPGMDTTLAWPRPGEEFVASAQCGLADAR